MANGTIHNYTLSSALKYEKITKKNKQKNKTKPINQNKDKFNKLNWLNLISFQFPS